MCQTQSKYFQQKTNYDIKVSLDDKSHRISGDWKMSYTNFSPDTLTEIYMHLWANAYSHYESSFVKQKAKAGDYTLVNSVEEGVFGYKTTDFSIIVKGDTQSLSIIKESPEIWRLQIPNGISPRDSVVLYTPFEIAIPYSFSRMGHVKNAYQITQWYPKPAVYDKYGWHPMEYLDSGEFYSEYGDFNVSITVPANYVVGASGELLNNEEIKWLYNKSGETRKLLTDSLALKEAVESFNPDEFPESSLRTKTLQYKLKNAHDFAWFADKRFHVLESDFYTASGRLVKIWSMFTDLEADLWAESIDYLRNAVEHFNYHLGEYPWKQVTAVEGALSAGAGMEYPNITIIGESGTKRALENVIVHEVGHNWLYGILGSNERDFAWMDEGINTHYCNVYEKERDMRMGYNNSRGFNLFNVVNIKNAEQFGIRYLHKYGQQVPLNYDAEKCAGLAYTLTAYSKGAQLMDMVKEYMGEEEFLNGMHNYYKTWAFKHPYPSDLFDALEFNSEVDLSPIKHYFLDYSGPLNVSGKLTKINGFETSQTGVRLHNSSKIPLLVQYSIEGSNGTKRIVGPHLIEAKGAIQHSILKEDITSFKIDPNSVIPGEQIWDNHTLQPISFHLLNLINEESKLALGITPIISYNTTDGLGLGVGIYSPLLSTRLTDGYFLPRYGIESKSFIYSGEIMRYFPLSGLNRYIKAGLKSKQFGLGPKESIGQFRLFNPYIEYEVQTSEIDYNSTIEFKAQYFHTTRTFDSGNQTYTGFRLSGHWEEYEKQNQRSVKVDLDANQHFSLRTTATIEKPFIEKGRRNIRIRAFAGVNAFKIGPNGNQISNNPLRTSGFLNSTDFFGEYGLVSRNIGDLEPSFINNQHILTDGGIRLPGLRNEGFVGTEEGDWVMSVMLDVPIPTPEFLRFLEFGNNSGIYAFADVSVANFLPGNPMTTQPLSAAGLSYRIFNGALAINFPIVSYSSNFFESLPFGSNISWSCDLNELSPYKWAPKLNRLL